MSTSIRSLVIPVTDIESAKKTYGAILGEPSTDKSYYVGYNVNGFEVALAPGQVGGGPVANADVDDLDAARAALLAAGASERDAPRQVAPASGSRCCWTPTATRSATRRLISARSQ